MGQPTVERVGFFLCDAEVDQLGHLVTILARQQNIGGFDVAVHDAARVSSTETAS
jgi:hypothetical protein